MNGSFSVGQRNSGLFYESAPSVSKLSDSSFVATEEMHSVKPLNRMDLFAERRLRNL
ncbi:MAG: hypothetical protein WBV69_20310 [Candidatus Sulfotelmatobacter sp.]